MLLEAIASAADDLTARTLGDMCDQVRSSPHATVKGSLEKLYGFASDYPGVSAGRMGLPPGSRAPRRAGGQQRPAHGLLLRAPRPGTGRGLAVRARQGLQGAATVKARHTSAIAIKSTSVSKFEVLIWAAPAIQPWATACVCRCSRPVEKRVRWTLGLEVRPGGPQRHAWTHCTAAPFHPSCCMKAKVLA